MVIVQVRREGIGVPKPMWLDFAVQGLIQVHVCVMCLMTAKRHYLGLPRFENLTGGHGGCTW
jgi:hypothetical protein